jgi:DNA-binding MarR family transcriptional regulator
MPRETASYKWSDQALFDLPCACQSARRLARVMSRIYDAELRKAGLEITQFGLLTALATTREVSQKRLSAGLAMDSTTLTRTLRLVREQGWASVRPGHDRRERLFRLTPAGERQLVAARPYWERAERRLRRELGDGRWKGLGETLFQLTRSAANA